MSAESAPTPLPPAENCLFLTGPTASGKTKVGLELARQLGAEIVSLDSMALYREMDIGTAKPAAEDRSRVPHHLLDLVSPSEEFSLSDYVDAAHAAIRDIRGRGREVLFVGGTPLYLKALLRGVYQGPPADWDFRRQIDEELRSVPITALHDRLQVIDPLLAAKLHPHDKRRIVRGLEVFRLTGQRLSHLQTQFDEGHPASQANVFVLQWPREALHRRIDARVEQMFAAGLVDEVRRLLDRYGTLSRTAMQAVGYREVIQYVQGAENRERQVGSRQPSLAAAECLERVKARTRQFARRQETWFRSLVECRFVSLSDEPNPAAIAGQIEGMAKGDGGVA
jgi:tRNA dimethylallyltransferase